ncbi:MAG: hypothetical protein COU29_03480 [Candidatus Magasanikbacteria bacterium CG10_big_fil_rev_8_21_14_0_10_36_32]|uniref:Uncharacterized protein n=1 Tax=Candidatus Magasanikbacteria bacterium CG10_big_fil_rev_8_21_14_0_10_36_32 TaxID=1974646 RepID=A0A2M6W5I3_9BACT|nr:MAG: hypothetical protein COU29_03480 [Candidatus Magasanikbacteria bacterium CG10_big_fil_rev_8_21_14_0_10_36_32]
MFDEPNQNKIPEPPKNLAAEPVDMFAGLDDDKTSKILDMNTALNAGVLKKKESEVDSLPKISDEMKPGVNEGEMYEMKNPILGKVIIVIGVMALVSGVGYGVWNFYSKKTEGQLPQANLPLLEQSPVTETDTDSINNDLPTQAIESVEPVTNTAAIDMGNDRILFGEAVDTDKDGLDDVRERELGTNINNTDTDNDELSDSDEVIIWKTDPLNPDTDDDSYKDGEEVRNGYNPLGPGKLFASQMINTTVATTATGTVLEN